MLDVCISQSQAAFVPSHQTIDNLIVAHEYIRWLNHRRKGNDAYIALKIDMPKTYDLVEWNILYAIISKMGFCPLWIKWIQGCLKSRIKWIHGCLKSMSFFFNVNGEKYGYVCPSSGIRQVYPLISFFFVLKAFQAYLGKQWQVKESLE